MADHAMKTCSQFEKDKNISPLFKAFCNKIYIYRYNLPGCPHKLANVYFF